MAEHIPSSMPSVTRPLKRDWSWGVVDLEGGVFDAEVASQHCLQFPPALVAVDIGADDDMGGEGGEARGDCPDVSEVYA
jgi:hypothetical protein